MPTAGTAMDPIVDQFRQVLLTKLGYFALVLAATTALTAYSVLRSKRLADFLEALADERMPGRGKLAALADIWRGPSGAPPPDAGGS
jgi:hypothetical protein